MTTAEQLADAVLHVAHVNHYMVGLDAETTAGISFDNYSDAHRILVDRELKAGQVYSKRFNRAFHVLGTACYRAHRVHLGE